MEEVSAGLEQWDWNDFEFLRPLQEARGNFGHVDAMRCRAHGDVAVKQMPVWWVTSGPREFDEKHPEAGDQPWHDLGLLQELGRLNFPYLCDLLAVLSDGEQIYVVTHLVKEGDLIAWCAGALAPGRAREAAMRPLAGQLFDCVQELHDLGVAHRDLSLENFLLDRDCYGELHVKVIDFGMATTTRICRHEVCGKPIYIAPEMHGDEMYDTFACDTFALGVVLYALAADDYPWRSTSPGSCKFFEFASAFGLRKLLERRRPRRGAADRLAAAISPALAELLEGLLCCDPEARWCLHEEAAAGGSAGKPVGRRSVRELQWLRKEVEEAACDGAEAAAALWQRCSTAAVLGGA